MKQIKNILFFVVFLLLPALVFAQPDKDKIVKLKGNKFYEHIVIKKETVYGIAKDFNVSVKDIVLENPKAIDGISPGDTLRIPLYVPGPVPKVDDNKVAKTDSTAGGKYLFHKVEAHETLYSLGKQYGASMTQLDSLNPDLKDKGLRIGMNLKVPNKNYSPPVVNPPVVNQPVANQPVSQPLAKRDTAKEAQAFKNLVNAQNNTPPPAKVEGKMLKRYDIVLMLTFSLGEVDSVKMNRLVEGTQQFPLLAQISTGFYAGVKMALDSLAMQGFNAELHVFNIPTDTSIIKLDSILKSITVTNANLIIGPAYPSLFNRVAKYAKLHQIPVVSPLSPESWVIKDNPFASKAVPSSLTEIEQMADYIAAHSHQDNIIILHNNDAANDNYYDSFKKRLNSSLSIMGSKGDSAKIVKYTDDLNDLGKYISDNKLNVIVVPYQGNSFVPKLVNQLSNSKYTDRDSMCVFGMHNWSTMDVLDPNNLDTIHLHFPTNDYVDYSNHAISWFIQKYRNAYYAEPSIYTYQGFDIAYFYGTMLKKYGTALQDNLPLEKYKGIHTSFDFYKPDPAGGYENKAIYMLEYKNFNLVKDPL
jgi:LysM repeat protein/ABC-type branched-subunit amino acid transport system substrate-binding protein